MSQMILVKIFILVTETDFITDKQKNQGNVKQMIKSHPGSKCIQGLV